MNDAQLRCFHVAAVEQSVTRAAARLGISQPTVSAQIKALEDGYGVRLFRRSGRKIELTDFGARLRTITEQLYAAQDAARELLVGTRDTSDGHIRIGAVAPVHVFPILCRLRDHHPNITFSMRVGNSTSIHELVSRYDIDVAIMANVQAGDQRLYTQFLRRDEIVIYMESSHPLAEHEFVTYEMIKHDVFIMREQGSVTRRVFLGAMSAADAGEPRILEIESREAIKEAVAYGFGIAPLLRSETGLDERCVAVPIAPPAPVFDEYVVCPSDLARSPLIKAFLEAARTVSTQMGSVDGVKRSLG